jgi:hypothetical protein
LLLKLNAVMLLNAVQAGLDDGSLSGPRIQGNATNSSRLRIAPPLGSLDDFLDRELARKIN